jgi:DNA repair exonuclease SbcCD ATPase subunit
MRFRRAKPSGPEQGVGQSTPRPGGRPGLAGRLRRAEREIRALRRRMAELEDEVQEARHLNKRLAEIADVVAEVLLPAEQRDEERLRDVLSRYDATL